MSNLIRILLRAGLIGIILLGFVAFLSNPSTHAFLMSLGLAALLLMPLKFAGLIGSEESTQLKNFSQLTTKYKNYNYFAVACILLAQFLEP